MEDGVLINDDPDENFGKTEYYSATQRQSSDGTSFKALDVRW